MSAVPVPEPLPIAACTVSRDVRGFGLLVEDMDAAMGEGWGDLGFEEAMAFLGRPEAADLLFVAVALGPEDEADLQPALGFIAAAKAGGVKVILVARDLSPVALHRLLREGGDEFVPYPLPEGELARAISRVTAAPAAAAPALPPEPAGPRRQGARAEGDRAGVVIPVYAMAGGTGATTLAVNLAWELALLGQGNEAPRVCLLDLGLQWGSVASFLDLPRREAVLEVLSDLESMDAETFAAALVSHGGKLHVLTAPAEIVPLDMVGPAEVERLIAAARARFDYVVIDMPAAVAHWGEAVLQAAHLCFATLQLDMRSAQNVQRFKRALVSEGLPFEKMRFVLNRAPGPWDVGGKARVKRLAESLGIGIEVLLPDGGRAVAESADGGTPLAQGAPRNALRRAVQALARSVHEVNAGDGAPGKAPAEKGRRAG